MNRSLQVLHKIIPSTEQSQNQEEPILPYGHYAIKHVARAWHDLEGEYEPSAPKHKTYTASRNLRLHKPQFLSPSNKVLRHLPSARRFKDRFTSCSSTQDTKPNSSRVTSKEPSPPLFPGSIPRPNSSMGRGGTRFPPVKPVLPYFPADRRLHEAKR